FAGIVLDNTNLTGTSFAGATFTGARGKGITGTPSALPLGWGFKNGWLVGPGVDLTGADLSKINIGGVDLTGAILTGVFASSTTGTPSAMPTGWKFIDGY